MRKSSPTRRKGWSASSCWSGASGACAQASGAGRSPGAGQEAQVLFEERREDGLWYGHTPDYLLVAAEGQGEDLHNGLRRVLLTQPRGEALLGRILPCAPAENQVN